MNTQLLNGLVKVAPIATAAFSILLLAHGVHGTPNLHATVNGDPMGPGPPN
jgi:hypothetical protein